jgi:hypothetical protein
MTDTIIKPDVTDTQTTTANEAVVQGRKSWFGARCSGIKHQLTPALAAVETEA